MLGSYNQNVVLSSLFGCMACLAVASVVNAHGRVFLLDLRNSSDLQGFGGAERACAAQDARLASSDELRHAVVECSFSICTRGWLYGGTVGTTVCNNVGSALKAVDVRTENATEDIAHLDAFCVKDKGVPCGDPPSFPNARLQGHTGFEMGDELLYTCVPGYVMPNGHSAFSLMCDSCGEWYGLVQMCVKDETETHVDYEDKFTDAYDEIEDHSKEERPVEGHGEVYQEAHGATYPEEQRSQEQQDVSFSVEVGEELQDQQGQEEVGGQEMPVDEQDSKLDGIVKGGEEEEERGVEDSTGRPGWDEMARTDAAVATEAPVSLLSQKHLFWFPSEAFREEGHPVTQTTPPEGENRLRASGGQSEESKEYESQEGHYQHPVDVDDPNDHESYDHDNHDDDQDDHDDSRHHNQDVYNDSHHDDQDDNHDDSHHEDQDDHDDNVKHYIPAQHDDLDKHGRYDDHDNHDDHYDMGEHEDERDRVRYGSQGEYGDQDESYDEDHDHAHGTEDHDDHDEEHLGSEEHPDHVDHDVAGEHYDLGGDEDDRDGYTDHDRYDNHDHNDHEHDDHDHDHEHDGDDDGHQHVVFPMATDKRQNFTQGGAGGKPTATTDDTWLDGYPVVPEETEKGGSTEEEVGSEEQERAIVVGATDRPNEVEVSRPIPYTDLPEVTESPTIESDSEQGGVVEVWPGFIPTATPSLVSPEPSDSPSYLDTQDYDVKHAAPTHSWMADPTEHPFLDPAPPMHDDDIITGTRGMEQENTEHNLTGQTGERGEVEGERGETICIGEHCPPRPPTSSSRGPTVAAIIVAVCAVATAVIVGAWCYRRRQQKSSMYEMNGKGQSQSRQGQQIEMQQKV
ncbi:uncharacterized protein susd5 [Diretmus argenteus]